MSQKVYAFEMQGTASNGQTWVSAGVVECTWPNVFNEIMKTVFDDLTHGKAQYGHPGVGCVGPYDVTAMRVEQQALSS